MAASAGDIYAFSAPLLNGRTERLVEFAGRVLLIVNTASRCGFTPQFGGLERLYQTYKERGFEVLGFPCNQFGHQEPGTEEEIGRFCQCTYGVSFPMFARIDVNGSSAHPLYRYLKASRPGILGIERVPWNFTKFLVDRAGKVISRHAPKTDPKVLTDAIEALLNQPV